MTSRFDRLERLFSKRKSSYPVTPVTDTGKTLSSTSKGTQTSNSMFPSPSFIRPKMERMRARDEVLSPRSSRQARSLSDHKVSPHQLSTHHYAQSNASTSCIHYSPRLPTRPPSPTSTSASSASSAASTRSASVIKRRRDVLESGIHQFHFPIPPGYSTKVPAEFTPPTSPSSVSPLIKEISDERDQSSKPGQLLEASRSGQVKRRKATQYTAPASHSWHIPHNGLANKELPALSCIIPPTPQPTPDTTPIMRPVSDAKLDRLGNEELFQSALYNDIRRQLGGSRANDFLRKVASDSGYISTSHDGDNAAIREPTVDEFFSLSDDDIAESQLRPLHCSPRAELHPSLPPPASTASLPSPHEGPQLALSSTKARSHALEAAFEAARIASRYNFELVYVINLWPDEDDSAPPYEGASPASLDLPPSSGLREQIITSIVEPGKGVTGRLLAAYGLANVRTPFQISAAVHTKMLRTEGWIEYRNLEAKPEEFAHGYACTFYAGHCFRPRSADGSATPTKRCRWVKHNWDRGIIFAAYRKPGNDTVSAEVGCSPQELEALRHDATKLVQMVADVEATRHLGQAMPLSVDVTLESSINSTDSEYEVDMRPLLQRDDEDEFI